MFLGTYQVSFSGLRRIVLPRKFRGQLGEVRVIVLSKGLDRCIWGFDKRGWEEQTAHQLEIPLTDKRGRVLRRIVFSQAEEVEIDFQGRFVIPEVLLDFGEIKSEALIVGAGDHFEIWNPQIFKQETEQTEI